MVRYLDTVHLYRGIFLFALALLKLAYTIKRRHSFLLGKKPIEKKYRKFFQFGYWGCAAQES